MVGVLRDALAATRDARAAGKAAPGRDEQSVLLARCQDALSPGTEASWPRATRRKLALLWNAHL